MQAVTKDKSYETFTMEKLDLFRLTLINLPEMSLPIHPSHSLIFSNNNLDTFLCELIDSEIRSLAYQSIFDEILTILGGIILFNETVHWYY